SIDIWIAGSGCPASSLQSIELPSTPDAWDGENQMSSRSDPRTRARAQVTGFRSVVVLFVVSLTSFPVLQLGLVARGNRGTGVVTRVRAAAGGAGHALRPAAREFVHLPAGHSVQGARITVVTGCGHRIPVPDAACLADHESASHWTGCVSSLCLRDYQD